MGKDLYKLIISVDTISFINENIDCVYIKGTLEDIDRSTSRYQDAQSFFDYNMKYVHLKIKAEYENMHMLSPTEIMLGENGIYIVKCGNDEEKKIRPLFKTVSLGDRKYDLSDIIKNRLYKGNIKKFYECDQFREALGNYDSFFNGLDHGILSRILTDDYSSSDIVLIWDWIKDSKRLCPLMRFLLMDLEHFEGNINEYYYEVIPARENPKVINSQNQERLYTYRAPYNDD